MKVKIPIQKTGNNFLISLFILAVMIPGFASPDADRDISLLYLNAADSFFMEKKHDEAEVFLAKARLYDPDISDIHYISAMMKKEDNVPEALSLLKKALTCRDWHIYNEKKAFYELGMLYSRTRDHERAISSLYTVKEEYADDRDFMDSYSRSLIERGYFSEAKDVLSFAVRKYPDDALFKTRLAGIDKEYMDMLLLEALTADPSVSHEPEYLIELVCMNSDKGIKKELLEKIAGTSYVSPEVVIENAIVNGSVTEKDIETFASLDGLSDYMLVKKIRDLIKEKPVTEKLYREFEKYSGFVMDDSNNDGINELLMNVENGTPVWFSEDYNQDNLNDFFVSFDNGKPEFISIADRMLVVYYRYPYLKNVLRFGKDFNEVYSFRDRNAYFNIVEFSDFLSPPAIVENPEEKFEKIKNKADTYRKSTKDNILNVMLEYFKTERITNFESIDAALSVIKRGTIRDGKMVFADVDMNDDNVFETRETYNNGFLEGIFYDGDSDGIEEFKIEDSVKYWDLDEDGIYDVKEWTEKDGISYIQYSTGFDGVFNFMARFRGNIPTDVKKGDEWIKVSHDENSGIFWIGEKCGNSESIKPESNESYLMCGDRKIYIVKIGERFFAEVVD